MNTGHGMRNGTYRTRCGVRCDRFLTDQDSTVLSPSLRGKRAARSHLQTTGVRLALALDWVSSRAILSPSAKTQTQTQT